MRQSLATLSKCALTVVFAVVMVGCVKRLSAPRFEAAEEIPWHFNGVPLPWSEQRWENCYAQLRVYALLVATIVVYSVLVKIVNKNTATDMSSEEKALAAQNEAMERELEQARLEIARLETLLAMDPADALDAPAPALNRVQESNEAPFQPLVLVQPMDEDDDVEEKVLPLLDPEDGLPAPVVERLDMPQPLVVVEDEEDVEKKIMARPEESNEVAKPTQEEFFDATCHPDFALIRFTPIIPVVDDYQPRQEPSRMVVEISNSPAPQTWSNMLSWGYLD